MRRTELWDPCADDNDEDELAEAEWERRIDAHESRRRWDDASETEVEWEVTL